MGTQIRIDNPKSLCNQSMHARAVDYSSLLNEREREIVALVATGASNKEIARQLYISIKTVKNNLTNVFVKTGTRSRTELAIQVLRAGGLPREGTGARLELAKRSAANTHAVNFA